MKNASFITLGKENCISIVNFRPFANIEPKTKQPNNARNIPTNYKLIPNRLPRLTARIVLVHCSASPSVHTEKNRFRLKEIDFNSNER